MRPNEKGVRVKVEDRQASISVQGFLKGDKTSKNTCDACRRLTYDVQQRSDGSMLDNECEALRQRLESFHRMKTLSAKFVIDHWGTVNRTARKYFLEKG